MEISNILFDNKNEGNYGKDNLKNINLCLFKAKKWILKEREQLCNKDYLFNEIFKKKILFSFFMIPLKLDVKIFQWNKWKFWIQW